METYKEKRKNVICTTETPVRKGTSLAMERLLSKGVSG